jgi:hypothetical protein
LGVERREGDKQPSVALNVYCLWEWLVKKYGEWISNTSTLYVDVWDTRTYSTWLATKPSEEQQS